MPAEASVIVPVSRRLQWPDASEVTGGAPAFQCAHSRPLVAPHSDCGCVPPGPLACTATGPAACPLDQKLAARPVIPSGWR